MNRKPTLAEFLGLDWVLCINEIFDSTAPVKQWKMRGNINVGELTIGDEDFEIYLEPIIYKINDKVLQVINIAFAKIVAGKPTEELQLNSKNASAIIGAVVNAVRDKLPEYKYDAIVFAAADNVEQRMRVYSYVARQLKGKFKHERSGIDTADGGKVTILFSKSVSPEIEAAFDQHLKDLGK